MKASEFLAAFFAQPNDIPLGEIAPQGKAKHLLPWVARLGEETPSPTVLPYRRQGRVNWYGLAFSDMQLEALGDHLSAFVGPTYSTFRGRHASLDPNDPIEAAVLQFTGGHAYKFTGPQNGIPIWNRLELMRAVESRRPDRVLDPPRPTGRVLRDFYMALQALDTHEAEVNLRYLVEQRRLTPNNILFLRVQQRAAFGEWRTLLDMGELGDLLRMRRPLAVTEALLQAVYHVELEHFESYGRVDDAIDHFRHAVLPDYGMLLVRRAGMRVPEALKALMLLAVAGQPPDPELRDAVWATRGLSEETRLYLKLLADRLPGSSAKPQADPMQVANAARESGNYEGAYALALRAPITVSRARLLLECAYELQTLDAERAAATAVEALDKEQKIETLRGRRYRETYERVMRQIPDNWIEWMERVHEDNSWGEALEIARRGALEWSVDDLLAVPGSIAQFTDLLASTKNGTTVQNALPHLLTFFEADALWPRPELAPIYGAALELLAVGSFGAEDDIRVYARLADATLELGLDATAYTSLIEGARHLLHEFASPGRLQWGLELLETTVVHPCPDEAHRLNLLFAVIELLQKFWRRVDSSQRTALRLLCEDLGQLGVFAELPEPPLGASAPPDVLSQLNGKTIAIYTLAERAAKYMQQILADRAPKADVHLAHDKVATERLRQLARQADLFIMATGSAKHAATEFIESNRPPELPLLRPFGNGMASMLQVLRDYLISA